MRIIINETVRNTTNTTSMKKLRKSAHVLLDDRDEPTTDE